jgi:hypothetical protein
MTKPIQVPTSTPLAKAARPVYVPPRIRTYTSDEILEQVGPALTGSGDLGPPIN